MWAPWFPGGGELNFQVWKPYVFGPDAGCLTHQVLGSDSEVKHYHGDWRTVKRLEKACTSIFWLSVRRKQNENC